MRGAKLIKFIPRVVEEPKSQLLEYGPPLIKDTRSTMRYSQWALAIDLRPERLVPSHDEASEW
jgi:hypothetical protein